MLRLFQIEFQKIWKSRAGKILSLSYFVILCLLSVLAFIDFNLIGIDFKLADMGIFNFPYIWHFNTYLAAILKLFLAIVIVSMMSNEYSYGTLKQNLIDGLSKKEFILSKFITVVFFALISTIFVFLVSLVIGLSFSSYTEPSIVFSGLSYLPAYFLKLTAFFSFCLFLGILVKRSAFALGFLFVWNILELIIMGLLGKYFTSKEMANQIYGFFPLESMSRLIVEPFSRLSAIKNIEQAMSGVNSVKNYDVSIITVLAVLAWTVIFVLMSYKILQKRDL
jgi:ABC-type transport system involved in multi-copper enzyme maturation permease subunit